MNQLDQLRAMTTVVADTGEIDAIRKYLPTDATTNPSLLLKAARMPEYVHLVDEAVDWAHAKGGGSDFVLDRLAVNVGTEILKYVAGRVSTEVDARLSFDTSATVERAERLIGLYAEADIPRERVLIKIASTWEGIQAARILEKKGIHCNMTLLFHISQAVACADAGATLISPFVGRILDWYKKNEGGDYGADNDPGVLSVRGIYCYYKKHGYSTEVMGASFRNVGEILGLAGCDLLTIAPSLLDELKASEAPVPRRLDPAEAMACGASKVGMDEKAFRWRMNEDAMATEKLAEGIRNFAKDTRTLEDFIRSRSQV